jgi:hypothetical protein
MKITIELDETKITKKEAVRMTLDCLNTESIGGRIKPDKNVKFNWHSKDCAVMTQQGTHQIITRSV